MSSSRLAAVVQLTSKANTAENLEAVTKAVKAAKAAGAVLVSIPEGFDFIGDSAEKAMAMAEPLHGPLMGKYRALAASTGVWLSLGGFHEASSSPDEKRIHNTHVVVDHQGAIKAVYRKAHLYDVDLSADGGPKLLESAQTLPGDRVVVIDSPIGKLGLAVCYDLRFPEFFSALRKAGAEVILVPSAFTVPTGMAHWEPLLRARAIETQSYVLAAAQVGSHHAKRASYGHSIIIDPWGTVSAQSGAMDSVPGFVMASIDPDVTKSVRARMPLPSHRRPDAFYRANQSAPAFPTDLEKKRVTLSSPWFR